ncbi:sulfurtransferase [Nakamurella sp.]|uniref:sulfurtransferase n=1 Tax=Nakamurella sp. TaxID=1869182 RepID=UPI0037831CBB
MNVSPRSPLIPAAELSERMAGGSPPVLLDVRWTLAGGSDPDGFLAGRVPGARFLDLDRDLAAAPGPGGRHPLPDPADLQAALRAVGLHPGDDVVVYDGGPGLAAARAWWLLRWAGLTDVRVLDGGWPAWAAASARPTESGPADPVVPGTIAVTPGGLPVVDADGAAAAADAPGAVLLDLRAAARYRGEVEPLDPVAGHIPGAVNLPIADLMRADGTYRPAAEIAEQLHAAGVGPGTDVVASCGSGITACQLVLAAEQVGIAAMLYPGSYSQWCALGRPVATGG